MGSQRVHATRAKQAQRNVMLWNRTFRIKVYVFLSMSSSSSDYSTRGTVQREKENRGAHMMVFVGASVFIL
jgi:hypothetical protein